MWRQLGSLNSACSSAIYKQNDWLSLHLSVFVQCREVYIFAHGHYISTLVQIRCVCACMCACVCVCFCMITQKEMYLWNMKLEYIVVYGNSSREFGNEHYQIKVKITGGLHVSPFTTIHTVRSYNSILAQARKLILSMYFQLKLIYKFHDYCHA